MNFIGKYISSSGELKLFSYKITHTFSNLEIKKLFVDKVLKPLSDSIIIIRDESDFYTGLITTPSRVKTERFDVELDTYAFEYIQFPIPSFGGISECIKNNLNMMTQLECSQSNLFIENTNINILPMDNIHDSMDLPLNRIMSGGIKTYVYRISFVFESSWSVDCNECASNMSYLRNELGKLSSELFVEAENPFTYSGQIISDFDLSSTEIIKTQIMSMFEHTLSLAKVSEIKVSDVTNDVRGYEE